MKFKGDIIITDPCYLIPDKYKRGWIGHPDAPKWTDYHKDENGNPIESYNDLGNIKNWIELHKRNVALMEEAEKQFKLERPELFRDDWSECNYGEDLEILGIRGIGRNTIYGDWSCTTYNSDTKEEIGSFCADAGMVCVALLEDVLKYNPEFNYHIKNPWTTTWIKDFDGEVDFEVHESDGDDEGEVRVVGKGNINFITSQTGL